MQRQKMKTDFQVGDLVYVTSYESQPLGIIVKAKNLLKLYDVLLQLENIYLKNVNIDWLKKAI